MLVRTQGDGGAVSIDGCSLKIYNHIIQNLQKLVKNQCKSSSSSSIFFLGGKHHGHLPSERAAGGHFLFPQLACLLSCRQWELLGPYSHTRCRVSTQQSRLSPVADRWHKQLASAISFTTRNQTQKPPAGVCGGSDSGFSGSSGPGSEFSDDLY